MVRCVLVALLSSGVLVALLSSVAGLNEEDFPAEKQRLKRGGRRHGGRHGGASTGNAGKPRHGGASTGNAGAPLEVALKHNTQELKYTTQELKPTNQQLKHTNQKLKRTVAWDASSPKLSRAARWATNDSVAVRSTALGFSACHIVPDFVPQSSPAEFPLPPRRKPKTPWFMSMSKPDDHVSQTYVKFAKAATVSARLNAPSLAPYFVYTYLPHQDIDEPDDELVIFLKRAGTRVLKWRLSFFDDIPVKIREAKQGHINVGAFGRLDVPLIVSTVLHDELSKRGLDSEFVLYTDVDVMFARDWPAHSELYRCGECFRGWPNPKCCRDHLGKNDPAVFLAGTEVFAIWGLNSGVMYLNVQRLLWDRRALLDWGNSHAWNFVTWDQGLLESFYRQKARLADAPNGTVFVKGWHAWDSFDDGLYNARGFSKPPGVSPYIWHWHGYKPYDVECWLGLLERGTWVHTNTVAQELKASAKKGCRGLINGRMAWMHECSLSLYLTLYSHYERLLLMADAISAPEAPTQ
ncbi:hypothetical protein M885DRAFT_506711 [Pelagophyceae sp. CCMP2097]|nr:hypothetical protein M885DRAFT_506711 [Pelagophyceae sp. CCMP2097]|mmetsp:Transcript_20952/g.72141  ORF Transcript_20952/g.72141 Transcript_20952/m.72141 type:complete len:521 (-) Transcript_20952:32-1594(-)